MEENTHTRIDIVAYEPESGMICARLFDWSPREVTVQIEAHDHVGQGRFYLFISRDKAVKWLQDFAEERKLDSRIVEVPTQTAEIPAAPETG